MEEGEGMDGNRLTTEFSGGAEGDFRCNDRLGLEPKHKRRNDDKFQVLRMRESLDRRRDPRSPRGPALPGMPEAQAEGGLRRHPKSQEGRHRRSLSAGTPALGIGSVWMPRGIGMVSATNGPIKVGGNSQNETPNDPS